MSFLAVSRHNTNTRLSASRFAMKKSYLIYALCAVTFSFFASYTSAETGVNDTQLLSTNDGAKIYWSSLFGTGIRRSNPDGSDVETVISEWGGAYNIAVDMQNEKVYWSDQFRFDIRRANLDGTNIEIVVPNGTAINPQGIALDVDGGKMYWTDERTPIRRANLDGSDIEDLVLSYDFPYDIALDVDSGKMYWQERFSWKIRRANLDGSGAEDLLVAGFGTIFTGLALDIVNGKMYWADLGNDKISRANLDGSQAEDVLTILPDSAFNPEGIALDVEGGKMYWNASGPLPDRNWRVQRANLDGSDGESVYVSQLYDEVFIDIEFVSAPVITVQIDIKPKKQKNSINPLSSGLIAVAILTTDDFDALWVDPSTVYFGPNSAVSAHGEAHASDVDRDGDIDLLFHFKTQETGIQCGDTAATLIGETWGGTAISGIDSINTVGCR